MRTLLPLALLTLAAPAWAEAPAAPAPQAAAMPPLYSDRPLTEADLQGKDLTTLAKMRNTIYARAHQVFRKSWLRDYFAAQPWYRGTGFEPKLLSETDTRNAELIARFEKAIPRAELEARARALQAAPATKASRLELALLGRALGTRLPGADEGGEATPLDDPGLLEQQLSVEQLKDLSRSDLRLVRNMVYARRGRPFRSPDLQAYFGRMSWYHADPKYTDARLTKTDRNNAKLIKSVEDSLGGEVEKDAPELVVA